MELRPVLVVPVKDRDRFLVEILARLPTYLEQASGIDDYLIVVAEQIDPDLFSTALAKDVGAGYGLSCFDPDYLVFNDVDMIPLKDVDYRFDGHDTICFLDFGSCKVSAGSFRRANGFNPRIRGWGYEDVEFHDRLECMGIDSVRWDRSAEAEDAHVIDLELRNATREEDLEFSRWYWRRDDDRGPKLVSPDWPLEPHDKSVWYSDDIKARNLEFVNRIYNMRTAERLAYYQANGLRSLDLSSIEVEQRDERIVHVRFDSAKVLAEESG